MIQSWHRAVSQMLRKASLCLIAPFLRVYKLLEVVRRHVKAPQNFRGSSQIRVRFVRPLRKVVGLDRVVLLVLDRAEHVEGARLRRIHRDRGAQILFRRAEQVLDFPLIGRRFRERLAGCAAYRAARGHSASRELSAIARST